MAVWKLVYYWGPDNGFTWYATYFLQYMVLMNVGLAVFNLIPVPPLDGSRVLLVFLPRNLYFGVMRYEKVILVILLAVVSVRRIERPHRLDVQPGLGPPL